MEYPGGRKQERPTFLQDVKTHLKSVRLTPCRCRLGYIAFLLVFVAVMTFLVGLSLRMPQGHDPPCAEGVQSVRIFKVVMVILLVTTPSAFIFIYCRILEKHFSMIICMVLMASFCFSLSGSINAASWFGKNVTERRESILEYLRKEYASKRRIPRFQMFTETKQACCGIDDFTDYPGGIFNEERVPDHCCVTNQKGCGRFIFDDTPLAYSKVKEIPAPPVTPLACLFTSKIIKDEIVAIVTRQNQSYSHLNHLIGEFRTQITEADQCNDLTMNNFRDYQCVTTPNAAGTGSEDFYIYKYAWCYIIFYNESSAGMNWKKMNEVVKLVKPKGCRRQLNEYADTVIAWTLIGFVLISVLNFILLLVYLKYYDDYRATQLTILPLPLWYQRLPGETEEMVIRGLGRPCHVNEALALTSEKEASAYLRHYPKMKKEGLKHIKEQNEQEPKEWIPRAAVTQNPRESESSIMSPASNETQDQP